MGINGLLRALKPFTQPVHVKKYSGQRVGIDAYSWLHKGGYACSMELCEQWSLMPAEDPYKLTYINYCMNRIRMLRYHNVIPVVVFDGGRLPLKAATEQDRLRKRQVNLHMAREKNAKGDLAGAVEFYQRAVDVTPLMAYEFIRVLKAHGVDYVVAPYEADAQLAWLANRAPERGGVVAVISEDSDLLAYACPVVLFKMDKYGHGEEISVSKLFGGCKEPVSAVSFRRFSHDMFLGMCVLAGCDFLPSIPGIGIMKAYSMVEKHSNLDRVLSRLAVEKKVTVPEGYISEFWHARAIFLHARVYNTEEHTLDFLNPLPDDFEEKCGVDTNFLGPELPQSTARAIALGYVDPISLCAFNVMKPKPGSYHPPATQCRVTEESMLVARQGPFSFSLTTRASSAIGCLMSKAASQVHPPPPPKDQATTAFTAQLQHMSSSQTSTVLQDFNWQKRMLPPAAASNNPFKKVRQNEQENQDKLQATEEAAQCITPGCQEQQASSSFCDSVQTQCPEQVLPATLPSRQQEVIHMLQVKKPQVMLVRRLKYGKRATEGKKAGQAKGPKQITAANKSILQFFKPVGIQ